MKKFILILIAIFFCINVVSCSEEKLPEPETLQSLSSDSEGDDGEDPIIQD